MGHTKLKFDINNSTDEEKIANGYICYFFVVSYEVPNKRILSYSGIKWCKQTIQILYMMDKLKTTFADAIREKHKIEINKEDVAINTLNIVKS